MSQALLFSIAALFAVSAALVIVVFFNNRRAAKVRAADFATIAQCAVQDRLESQQLKLIATIFRRWPDSVRVTLNPEDPVTRDVRPRLHAGRMPAEILLHIYRVKPSAVEIVLDPKRHKMQICDAQKLGLPVTIFRASSRVATMCASLPTRPSAANFAAFRRGKRNYT